MVLRGNSPAKVDAQGRIKIPTAHRGALESYGKDFYVTSVTGQNVLIYPVSEWAELEAKLQQPPRMLPEKQRFLRNTSYFGNMASIDKQGRILIHPLLRESAGIEAEVAVIGQLNHIDVWNQQTFVGRLESEPYTDKDAEALAALGI